MPLAICNVLLLSIYIGYTAANHKVNVARWIEQNDQFGPVLNFFCDVQMQCNQCTYRWIFQNKTLAENNDFLGADASRYEVDVKLHPNGYGSLLRIKNSHQDDGGLYECQVVFGNAHMSTGMATAVVLLYLPPPAYPKCSITPSSNIIDKTNATFTCLAGTSSQPVNLRLTLQRQDGSQVELGDQTVTRIITTDDNYVVFTCHMTSETFPTAYRNCSVGPITVSQNSGQDGQGSIVGGSIAAVLIVLAIVIICIILLVRRSKSMQPRAITSETHEDKSTPHQEPSHDPSNSYGTSSGQMPLYAQAQKNQTHQELSSGVEEEDESMYSYATVHDQNQPDATHTSNHTSSPDSDSTSSGQIPLYAQAQKNQTHQESSSGVKEENEAMYSYATVPNQNQPDASNTTNHTSSPDSYSTPSGQMPLYAQVQKNQTHQEPDAKEEDEAMYSYATVPDQNPPDASNIPIYGKVNKGDKTVVSEDEAGKRESSGFVDNIIYVPSDAK
ncbi:uncharacterized protein [Amphiura filiformis]|uniref:uncharacterized protein n=1 Tax=Amphiura filiformis TaxID=82378 RepID=UPI003B215544